MRNLLVSEILRDCRRQLDEDNRATVDDKLDLLPALNRAQDKASQVISRFSEDRLMASAQAVMAGTEPSQGYRFPRDALEERVEAVKVDLGGGRRKPLTRISYRDVEELNESGAKGTPEFWYVEGRKIFLLPTPTANVPVILNYTQDAPSLVLEQGRILEIGTNYLMLDSAGSDLTTSAEDLGCFVNIADSNTGEIKATFQLSNVNTETGKVQIVTSTPLRPSVFGRSVSTSFPATISRDDYICHASGTCIPHLKKTVYNFLVEYVVAEQTRRLGGDSQWEVALLERLERDLKGDNSGRENTLRVQRSSLSTLSRPRGGRIVSRRNNLYRP